MNNALQIGTWHTGKTRAATTPHQQRHLRPRKWQIMIEKLVVEGEVRPAAASHHHWHLRQIGKPESFLTKSTPL